MHAELSLKGEGGAVCNLVHTSGFEANTTPVASKSHKGQIGGSLIGTGTLRKKGSGMTELSMLFRSDSPGGG